jgi:hypothetical protein
VDRVILEDMMVFVSILVGMGCFTGIVTSYFKRRNRQVVSTELGIRLDEIADRLGRLDTAIDAMAVEVERISEAQRFTAKVLAERNAPNPAALPDKRPGPVTPH